VHELYKIGPIAATVHNHEKSESLKTQSVFVTSELLKMGTGASNQRDSAYF